MQNLIYKIHYLNKQNNMPEKMFYFQTEKQFNSWKEKKYGLMQEKYNIQIEKRTGPFSWEKIILDF